VGTKEQNPKPKSHKVGMDEEEMIDEDLLNPKTDPSNINLLLFPHFKVYLGVNKVSGNGEKWNRLKLKKNGSMSTKFHLDTNNAQNYEIQHLKPALPMEKERIWIWKQNGTVSIASPISLKKNLAISKY